jgi:glycosyltransferase involved in cell wall biosynthesis
MALLDAADVLLHPSHFDALPTTLLESLAAGTPIVASAVGGIPEIVDDGETGVLIAPPPSGEAIAHALEPLLADRLLRARMGVAARAAFEARFSAARWAQRLRAAYEGVM